MKKIIPINRKSKHPTAGEIKKILYPELKNGFDLLRDCFGNYASKYCYAYFICPNCSETFETTLRISDSCTSDAICPKCGLVIQASLEISPFHKPGFNVK